jgi:cell division protein FtsW
VNPRPRRKLSFGGSVQASNAKAVSSAQRRHKPDYWILVLTSLLLAIGLVVVYSISPGLAASRHISQNYFISKQLLDVVLAFGAFWLAAYMPVSTWLKAAKPLMAAAIVGSIVVMLMPVDALYPAHRWIRLGDFSFQIAELIKIALLVWTASFLAEQWRKGRLTDFNETLKPLIFVLLGVGVIVAKLQSDLGSAMVMIAMVLIMAFIAGIPLKKVLIVGGLIVMLVVIAIGSSSYRRERLNSFLHPQSHCQDSGYQACQALISVGSGGLMGLGLGYSVQAYGYLPEASNDSIFAIMAEKFGFVGSIIIISIYGLFIARLKNIIEHTADQFSRLLVVGILAWLSTQVIINVGSMLGLLPLKGITLPLISQGGTSLVFLTVALGMVFQISRYTSYNVTEPSKSLTQGSSNFNNFNGRRLGRPHNAALVTRPRT